MCCRLTTSLAVGHLTRKSGVLGSIHGGGGGGGGGGGSAGAKVLCKLSVPGASY